MQCLLMAETCDSIKKTTDEKEVKSNGQKLFPRSHARKCMFWLWG